MARPKVTLNCVADQYADKLRERIVEFSSGHGGGLISFHEIDGILHVTVYQQDATVSVHVGTPKAGE